MTPVVECRDLVCGVDQPILRDVSFTVEAGEIIALLGGSGSGKTTLLRTIVGLMPPLAGEVLLFGEPLHALRPDERDALLRRTGIAFQQDALFGELTVEDNVALPLRELTNVPSAVVREMVRMRLGLVGLAGFERRFPPSLSGGERKRAALARATILDAELVFADEPSAGLDPVVAATIDELLLELRSVLGCTLIVVSHELASIRAIADRAVMLAHGTVHAIGTIDELATSGDAEVHNFFHRVAEEPGARIAGAT